MSLMLFKYCLPAVLGYILFVGISGRFNPLSRPDSIHDRSSWLLGLWTGLSVTLVLTLGLHMAYKMSLEGVRSLFQPTAWLLTGLLLPGFVAYFIHRARLRKSERKSHLDTDDVPPELSQTEVPDTHNTAPQASQLADTTESDINIDSFDALFDSVLDEVSDTREPADTGTYDASELAAQDNAGSAPPMVNDSETTTRHDDTYDREREIHQIAANADSHLKTAHADLRSAREPSDSSTDIAQTTDNELQHTLTTPATKDSNQADLDKLQNTVARETALREETEKHLRVTRKALSVLESESREYEGAKAEMVMALEEALDDRTRETAAAEARAFRAVTHQTDAETATVELKQSLATAMKKLRRSTEARAHAVRTANKSIELAKQSARARKRSDAQLLAAKSALKNRQETISSLIRALEKEKRRTQDEVASMAKQLVLHEKQLKARRSLEEVARSVEGKLKTRLVKKIAKARPLSEDP